MPAIRYLVPYEVRVIARDAVTNRRTGCRHYLKTGLQSAAPPAYGDPIAGSGSTTTLLASFKAKWDTLIALCSVNYTMELLEMRSLIGRQFRGSSVGISSIAATLTDTHIVTASPHGLTTGQSASITGVTTPVAANGVWPLITRLSATEFTIPVVIAGAYTGPGVVQLAAGAQQWVYGDKETLADTSVGAATGDAVALFADASILRNNVGVGKSFRSRFSLAPIAETDVVDGVFDTAPLAAWNAALSTFYGVFTNGGSDTGSQKSYLHAVSQKLAFLLPTPFTTSATWAAYLTGMRLHPNMGSQVKRKVKVLG